MLRNKWINKFTRVFIVHIDTGLSQTKILQPGTTWSEKYLPSRSVRQIVWKTCKLRNILTSIQWPVIPQTAPPIPVTLLEDSFKGENFHDFARFWAGTKVFTCNLWEVKKHKKWPNNQKISWKFLEILNVYTCESHAYRMSQNIT